MVDTDFETLMPRRIGSDALVAHLRQAIALLASFTVTIDRTNLSNIVATVTHVGAALQDRQFVLRDGCFTGVQSSGEIHG